MPISRNDANSQQVQRRVAVLIELAKDMLAYGYHWHPGFRVSMRV